MIGKKYETLLFAFLMSIFMSLVVSILMTFINMGFADQFLYIWFDTYLKVNIIVFPAILINTPLVKKLVGLLVANN